MKNISEQFKLKPKVFQLTHFDENISETLKLKPNVFQLTYIDEKYQ